jgi:hypothetical protein
VVANGDVREAGAAAAGEGQHSREQQGERARS